MGEFFQVEGEEAAEAAYLGEDVFVEGLAREQFDALLGAIAGGDVDAGIGVGGWGSGAGGLGGGGRGRHTCGLR